MSLKWQSNTGEIIELDLPNYVLRSFNGFSDTPIRLMTQKSPYQHGTTLIDTILEPRNMVINLLIVAKTEQERLEKRRELVKIFSPRLGLGKIIWEQSETEKEYVIHAISEEAPVMPSGESGVLHQQVLINLLAPDPTWYNPDIIEFQMDASVNKRINLYNEGEVETPVEIIINGPCENPRIININKNEAIYINDLVLLENERIEINTKYGKKHVRHYDAENNRTNLFGKVDVGSSLFYLQPGNNNVDFRALSGEPLIDFRFHYRYAGV